MTDQIEVAEADTPLEMLKTPEMELKMLKQRADAMGITYSNNIGLETLRQKIADRMEGKEQSENQNEESESEPEKVELPFARPNALEIMASLADNSDMVTEEQLSKIMAILENKGVESDSVIEEAPKRQLSLREYLIQENMKLIRVRITNMDPKKKDLKGEILTVANEYLGTIRKFIPYGEYSDGGYHIPQILYKELESRKFTNIRTSTDKATGQIKVDATDAKEFSLEVMEPLTAEELKRLALQQAASGTVTD